MNQSTTAAELEDDTLELELSPEQLHGLAQAAEKARLEAAAPVVAALTPPHPRVQRPVALRFRLWHMLLIAAVLGASAALTWRAISQRTASPAMQHVMPHVAAAMRSPVAPSPSAPAQTAGTGTPPASAPDADGTVRVRNPFDHSEVFEFPAGTTKSDARAQIAQILLERAQDRRSHGVAVTPAKKHKTND